MTQYGFYFDSSRCTGCRTCEMACKDYKDLTTEVAFRKIYDCEGGQWEEGADGTYTQHCFVYHVSLACQHCDNPACVKVCPTTAMQKDSETGLVSVDSDRCIGCGYCHMACPYNAPKVHAEKGHSVKCNGCAERVAEGKAPICVDACPLRALDFGPIDELRSKYVGTDSVPPMPEASYTLPNIVVKECPATALAENEAGLVANILEVM